jgi:cytochrome P450
MLGILYSANEGLICGRRFAGSDTTAITSRSVFYHLITNPLTYRRLVSEIGLAFTDGQPSDPVAYAETLKLPYPCACTKEATRLHPSITSTLPRITPEGGDHIVGRFTPAGYRVGINPAVVHYDKGVFGEDANEFNPSRF